MKPTIWFSRIRRHWCCARLTLPMVAYPCMGKGETPAAAYRAWVALYAPVESLGREHA